VKSQNPAFGSVEKSKQGCVFRLFLFKEELFRLNPSERLGKIGSIDGLVDGSLIQVEAVPWASILLDISVPSVVLDVREDKLSGVILSVRI
jgi:hypothetical protein